jgi:AAA+ ATPase superfamily predicted ATPase
MIGRTNELNQLENMYESDRFEFLVMYGRRRVGKTTILQEFASRHDLIFFPCQEKNDALNLLDFSRVLQRYFDGDFIAPMTCAVSVFFIETVLLRLNVTSKKLNRSPRHMAMSAFVTYLIGVDILPPFRMMRTWLKASLAHS